LKSGALENPSQSSVNCLKKISLLVVLNYTYCSRNKSTTRTTTMHWRHWAVATLVLSLGLIKPSVGFLFWPFSAFRSSLSGGGGGSSNGVGDNSASSSGGFGSLLDVLIPKIRWNRAPLFGYSTYRHFDLGEPGSLRTGFSFRIGPEPVTYKPRNLPPQQQEQAEQREQGDEIGRTYPQHDQLGNNVAYHYPPPSAAAANDVIAGPFYQPSVADDVTGPDDHHSYSPVSADGTTRNSYFYSPSANDEDVPPEQSFDQRSSGFNEVPPRQSLHFKRRRR